MQGTAAVQNPATAAPRAQLETARSSPPQARPSLEPTGQKTVVAIILAPTSERDAALLRELDDHRSKHDYAFPRWLPHITLVPPLTLLNGDASKDSLGAMEEVKFRLQSAVKELQAFEMTLNRCAYFPLRKYHNIHLRPTGSGGKESNHAEREEQTDSPELKGTKMLCEMQTMIMNCFHDVQPRTTNTRQRSFVPHVSIGQSYNGPSKALMMQKAKKLANVSIACRVDRFQLFAKPDGATGPYPLIQEFLLSGAQGDSPYVVSTKDYAVHAPRESVEAQGEGQSTVINQVVT